MTTDPIRTAAGGIETHLETLMPALEGDMPRYGVKFSRDHTNSFTRIFTKKVTNDCDY